MRSAILTALLLLTATSTAAYAADAAQPKATRAKPAAMSDAQRRDLEQRIDALERKYEMQYRETDSPTGAPGAAPAAPAAAPAAKPATH
jgi:opacity protein-like surface antigen